MEAALAKAFVASGYTAGAAAVKAGAVMGGISTAATGLSLLSGVAGIAQSQAAYKQQAEGAKAQAYQEKLKAQEDANLRRERLLNALAAQNVQAGAGGVTGGTTAALALESTQAYQREQASADVMGQAAQDKYRSDVAGYKTQGKAAMAKGLLSMGTQLASIG